MTYLGHKLLINGLLVLIRIRIIGSSLYQYINKVIINSNDSGYVEGSPGFNKCNYDTMCDYMVQTFCVSWNTCVKMVYKIPRSIHY